MKTGTWRKILGISLAGILLAGLTGCQGTGPDTPTQADLSLASLSQSTAAFAAYKEIPLSVKPAVKLYRIGPGLENVTNKDRFEFSPQAENSLSKNGFVVVPGLYREFFSSYENNRYDSIPNFITTDAMLHNYHLYFDHLLRTLEKDKLRAELNNLTALMLTESKKQYETLKGTDWENAAKRNVAYFAVAARLLDAQADIPGYVSTEVNKELGLIAGHQEAALLSPVMNMGKPGVDPAEGLKEDYTQYNPRGHYTKSDDLQSYFQAMMWYGRLTFRVKSEDETKSAVLVTLLLSQRQMYDHWNRIYEPTNFFVGKSDDLGFSQYYEVLSKTFGEIKDQKELTGNKEQWQAFCDGLAKLEPPAINSMPIFDKTVQPDREKEIKGFRFMGQRFTIDAAVFQNLVYREVEENAQGQRRMLPKGLDIPAAMGSGEAYAILESMGETGYKYYPEKMKMMQGYFSGLDTAAWTPNLYWSWLYTLAPLTEAKGDGYPVFMNNPAWTRKQLETFLGSWTELKHDTILYAKQVYAEMGGGELPLDDRGYVEPNPVVYGRLAALTRMTIEGLNSRGLLNEKDQASLGRLEELALKLKSIADKELVNQHLDDQDYELIRGFGGQLEHFWLEALSDQGVDHRSAIGENPAALIADVATNPGGGQVLEEGTGFVHDIYVVVPVEGELRIAKGGVYSYYEFPWPVGDRLTDGKWKEMLESGKTVDQPDWVQTYSVPAW